ncbi:MAG: hypothetical protein IJ364_07490, partial [Oscillospiraceae bacterium]|nr:hypothetical protein [Oscillospiraceae bacterium]
TAPGPTAEVTATPDPEPAAEPEELTPAQRAAAKGLPEPPDVDVSSWEFKIVNSYNNILRNAPPYAGIEGQGIDSRIFDITCQLLADARAAGYPMYLAAAYRNCDFQYTHFCNLINRWEMLTKHPKSCCPPATVSISWVWLLTLLQIPL